MRFKSSAISPALIIATLIFPTVKTDVKSIKFPSLLYFKLFSVTLFPSKTCSALAFDSNSEYNNPAVDVLP
ncbi:MAG: hypothetical protein GQ564_00065 [Bacteroidales bacterium]|nr:hypothetical protein [Bacteroidales bacterium]